MEKTNPIKRSSAIAEFSRDHHFSLLLVWKIREGLKRQVEPQRIAKYIAYYFEPEITPSFRSEEELLFSMIPADNEMRKQAEAEHKEIFRMKEEVMKNPSDKNLLQQFADALESHTRFEDRQFFQYIQNNLQEDELQKTVTQLKPVKHEDEDAWADPFWK